MGFSQAHPAIDKKRVIDLGRGIAYRDGSGMGKAVGRADNKVFKGVAGVKINCRQGIFSRLGRLWRWGGEYG